MDRFDEKIIGYESTKNILRQILDALKRPELYKSKGASIPRGLLMESDPGLGKSLLATVFIKESGRKSYVFRKTSQENSFLDELRAAFLAAKEAAPSILLLEDLNLYVESNSPYAPEWACLQACIDDAKSTDLFVIATTNDTKYMPPSLLRPGRFDYTLYLDPPMGKIAERIVSYYLRDKDLAEDVLISDIVKAMPKVSCATLETVMNLAALNSTYQGHEHIYKDDVTDALLQVVYRLSKTDKSLDLTECQKIALHEAAHAVVGEILNPDSIGIVTIRGNQSCIGGFENGCSTYLKNEEELLNDITKTLAGKAGVSLIYGVMDGECLKSAAIQVGKQALFSLSLLAISIAAQGMWGGPAGIIVSIGTGIVIVSYTIADAVHQRTFAEECHIKTIEEYGRLALRHLNELQFA